jgi:hypothetical protein
VGEVTDSEAVSESVTLLCADCRPVSSSQSSFSFAPTSKLWSLLPGCVDFNSFAYSFL